jgi:hypothetical protein
MYELGQALHSHLRYHSAELRQPGREYRTSKVFRNTKEDDTLGSCISFRLGVYQECFAQVGDCMRPLVSGVSLLWSTIRLHLSYS